ncbi:MAG: hypothetical protein OEO77_07390 [Acidimicrobiia bacterium]|nr:hypothetical protein [Acidimicrobiia bacterium]
MTLEQRARAAADGIHAAISEAELSSQVPGTFTHRSLAMNFVSFGTAFVAVAIVGLLAVGFRGAGTVETTEPTVPGTIVTGVEDPAVLPPREPAPAITTVPEVAPPASPTTTMVFADVTPPALQILQPLDGATFTDRVLRFEGTTEPGAMVMAGRYAAEVDAGGRWAIVLILSEGSNRATFIATDGAGNVAESSVTVTYEPVVEQPPAEPPKTEPPPKDDPPPPEQEIEFTAHQVYGSCSESPPFDEFYGTAAPGSRIVVFGAYGEADAVADAQGKWSVRVVFAGAPYGEAFVVTVKNTKTGATRMFEFVSYAVG